MFLKVKGPGRLIKAYNNIVTEFLKVKGLKVVDKLIRGGFLDALIIKVTQFSRTKRLRTISKPIKGGLLGGNNDIVIRLL